MRYAVGIDLGTTFTSAAVSDANGTRMAPLAERYLIPSVAYRDPDGRLVTGTAADQPALAPERLARGFKRRLGDPTPLLLGGAPYSPTMLMAAQLRAVVDEVTTLMGGPPASTVLTCPAIWGPYRREQFAEVPQLASLGDVEIITEPAATATYYGREHVLRNGEIVAVYDLGAGTLDTTVLRAGAGGLEVLGTPESIEHLGDMDFEDALVNHIDERLGGAITRLDPADPASATAMAAVRRLCGHAKIELSVEPDVTLTLPLPSGPHELTISRREFNAAIAPSVDLTLAALRRTVASAGLGYDDLSAILLAGGSSRIPFVAQRLSERIGRPVRVNQNPKFTVALGAAMFAARTAFAPPTAGPTPTQVKERKAPGRRGRRPQWTILTGAAVLSVVLTVATSVLASDPAAKKAPFAAMSPELTATTGPLVVLSDRPATPYRAFVGSDQNWLGNEVGETSVRHEAITATVSDGLRATWQGGAPGQIYLQSVNELRDLSTYAHRDSGLVFHIRVHRPLEGPATIGAHCRYPCAAMTDVTALLRGLPVGQDSKITIPLSCLVAKGLDPSRVDTPFIVYSEGPFDATFRDVSWVPNAGHDPGTASCPTGR